MASHRFLFYAPGADAAADIITLDGDEHHHLSRVIRARPGDDVYATDGRGLIAACRVESVGANEARLAVVSTDTEERGRDLTLALALIRKERFAQALEQCVELGVTRVIPFATSGSHLRRIGSGTLERMRRVAVSAMKQSFRAHLPAVDDVVDFEALVARAQATPRVIVGEQGAPAPSPGDADTLIVVGPEAGLSAEETSALRSAGAEPVSVSRHRLRSETAAVALVSALAQRD